MSEVDLSAPPLSWVRPIAEVMDPLWAEAQRFILDPKRTPEEIEAYVNARCPTCGRRRPRRKRD
jgi:hypothetical protein